MEHQTLSNMRSTRTTDDFRAICERVAGINLAKFFHPWLREEYFPSHSYCWSITQDGSNCNIDIRIEQFQQNQIFWITIDFTLTARWQGKTLLLYGTAFRLSRLLSLFYPSH